MSFHWKTISNSSQMKIQGLYGKTVGRFAADIITYAYFHRTKAATALKPIYVASWRQKSSTPPRWPSGQSVCLVSGTVRALDPRPRQTKVFKTGRSGFRPWRLGLWI